MAGYISYLILLCILHLSLAKPFQSDANLVVEDIASVKQSKTKSHEITSPVSNQVEGTVSDSESGELEISGRMNLDFGQSGSMAMRPGGASSSMSGSNNFNVGLVGPNGGYSPLAQNSHSFGGSNSFGNSPQTWSGAGGGYGQSGFNGGMGQASSHGFKTQGTVPIGNGMSLLTNL